MSTLNLSTPHQVTVNLTGLPGLVATQYSAAPPYAAGANGWSMPVGTGTVTASSSEGVTATVTSATATIRRTVATSAGERRVRVKVQLADPEARPVAVQVSAPLGKARMVSGVPVWLEAIGSATPTAVDLIITKPFGATSVAVLITEVVITTEGAGASSWTLERTDTNGVARLATGALPGSSTSPYQYEGLRAPVSGPLVLVDREAALTGPVSYRLVSSFLSIDETVTTGPTGVVSTGHGVLHRVHSPGSTLHQVNVVEFRGSYASQAQPLAILGTDLPNVPTQPLQARTGTLVLYFTTLDAAEAVAADLRTGEVHQLRQDVDSRTAMDAYLVATALSVDRVLTDLPEPLWSLTANYLETARGLA